MVLTKPPEQIKPPNDLEAGVMRNALDVIRRTCDTLQSAHSDYVELFDTFGELLYDILNPEEVGKA